MLKVKVKTTNHIDLTIPIPYLLLSIVSSILSSKRIQTQLYKWANQDIQHHKHRIPEELFTTLFNKQLLSSLLKELKVHKGVVLVDVKAHDGTEVMVRL